MSSLGKVSIKCPHCGSKCRNLKSRQVTPLYREITYQCLNPDCDHIFVAELTPVRSLVPSSIPNPNVHLPVVGPRTATT